MIRAILIFSIEIVTRMSEVEVIQRLVDFDRSSFDAFLLGLRRLGWEEVTRNREIGHRSIKNTMVHILNVHEALLVRIAQRKGRVSQSIWRKHEKVRSMADLRKYRAQVWKEIDPFVKSLTTGQLHQRVKIPWFPGRYDLSDVFFQASFEQAHHLGEIIAAYWQMDTAPSQMMWIPTLLELNVGVD